MTIEVLLFASARELVGNSRVEISLADGARVADLRRELAKAYPTLKGLMPSVRFAVGTDYVDDAATLRSGASVACIPPVSGG
jgi:molybdopterin synthase sulfur carrier subunit